MAYTRERGSTYLGCYRGPDGKEQYADGGPFTSKVRARRAAEEEEAKLRRGLWVDPAASRQTFEAFADEWAGAQEWKDTSVESWGYVRARLLPLLGGTPLNAIDKLRLQRTRKVLGERYARSTTETTMAYAVSIMRAAHASGRIPRDPTLDLSAPRARADEPDGKVTEEQVPTRAEALAILEGAPAPYRAAVALGLAGLRIGEVLGLSADRLELPERKVTIDRQLQRVGGELVLTSPKTRGSKRTIVMPGVTAVELRRHLRDHVSDGLLFRGPRSGDPMRRDQFYDCAWKPALLAAGLTHDRFVFHSLRHFCASSLLAEGAPLTAVAGHLGDTVDTVSRTYVHWLRDDRHVPAAVLDRVLAPADHTRTDEAVGS